MMWLWLIVGVTTAVPDGTNFSWLSNGPRSIAEVCMVHVPGAPVCSVSGRPGSGHCTATPGWILNESGTKPNKDLSAEPNSGVNAGSFTLVSKNGVMTNSVSTWSIGSPVGP